MDGSKYPDPSSIGCLACPNLSKKRVNGNEITSRIELLHKAAVEGLTWIMNQEMRLMVEKAGMLSTREKLRESIKETINITLESPGVFRFFFQLVLRLEDKEIGYLYNSILSPCLAYFMDLFVELDVKNPLLKSRMLFATLYGLTLLMSIEKGMKHEHTSVDYVNELTEDIMMLFLEKEDD